MRHRLLATLTTMALFAVVLNACSATTNTPAPAITTTQSSSATTTTVAGTSATADTTTTMATDTTTSTVADTTFATTTTTTTTTVGTTTTTSATTTTTTATTTSPGTPNTPTVSRLLPGTPEAGISFATLARAPQDPAITQTETTRQIGRFLFLVSDNPGLPFNIACHIADNTITALLPAGTDCSALVPNFTFYGAAVLYNGSGLISRATAMDLTDDAVLTLQAQDGSSHTVTIHIETLDTGLPSMSLSTSGYAVIDSTTEYKSASFMVSGGEVAYAAATVRGMDCSVKGRGNTSWTYDKKGYTLRFDTKYSLLGLEESKNYVLLALYADRSLMRYSLGTYLSESLGLDYTMNLRHVDLWLNGEYVGVYGLVEKIEVEPARVNITDYVSPSTPVNEVGYLLEFDDHLYTNATEEQRRGWAARGRGYYDAAINEVFFYSDLLGEHWITIRTTNAKNLTADHVNYIAQVVENAATALKDKDFATASLYFDMDAFVDWYLIEEYLNNTDTDMTSSVYMYLDVGGKLTLGPLWDLDNGAGNHTSTAQATGHPLYDSENGWFSYLFQCPQARALLQTRWARMQTVLDGVPSFLDNTAAQLAEAAALNFRRWPLLGTSLADQPAAVAEADTYEAQVTYLKEYLTQRREALNTFFASL